METTVLVTTTEPRCNLQYEDFENHPAYATKKGYCRACKDGGIKCSVGNHPRPRPFLHSHKKQSDEFSCYVILRTNSVSGNDLRVAVTVDSGSQLPLYLTPGDINTMGLFATGPAFQIDFGSDAPYVVPYGEVDVELRFDQQPGAVPVVHHARIPLFAPVHGTKRTRADTLSSHSDTESKRARFCEPLEDALIKPGSYNSCAKRSVATGASLKGTSALAANCSSVTENVIITSEAGESDNTDNTNASAKRPVTAGAPLNDTSPVHHAPAANSSSATENVIITTGAGASDGSLSSSGVYGPMPASACSDLSTVITLDATNNRDRLIGLIGLTMLRVSHDLERNVLLANPPRKMHINKM